MKEQIKAALALRYPSLKQIQINKAVDKYTAEVIAELAQQLAMGNVEQGEISFASDIVRARCGRIDIDKKTQYVYSIMQEHPSTALVYVEYQGNSITHEVSKVIINPRFKKYVLDTLQQESIIQELNPTHLNDLEAKANIDVRVDVKSLESYIKATQATLKKSGHSEAYSQALTSNILIANALLDRVRVVDGIDVLREYWELSDSGRVYGHGLSLQRIKREVRNAALGHCHKYDFKASSYALMTSLALRYDSTLKVGAISEYITHRKAIRRRIAADIGVSEEWMKEIFTAIGFGAKVNDNPHSYVRGKLGAEKYRALMLNDEFSYIRLQFEAVTNLIHQEVRDDEFELFGNKYTQIDPKHGLKRNKAQKLAWLYQCVESQAMRKFVEFANATPLLTTHDCIYYKQKLPVSELDDISYKLRCIFSELSFEHEEIKPISYVDPKIMLDILAHKQHIAKETEEAKHKWVPNPNSIVAIAGPAMQPALIAETKEQYEVRRRAQFLSDIARAESGCLDESEESYVGEAYFSGRL